MTVMWSSSLLSLSLLFSSDLESPSQSGNGGKLRIEKKEC